MTQLGARPRTVVRSTYKGFHLVPSHGRIHAIPPCLDPEEVLLRGWVASHPAVLSAATREEAEALVDATDPGLLEPQPLGHCDGYHLVRYLGAVYGVPHGAGAVNLAWEQDRRDAGVVCGRTRAEVEERIRRARGEVPVEFAGWLPIYQAWGNCGRHPQFRHTAEPPPGYRFTSSAPPRREPPLRAPVLTRLVRAVCRLVAALWAVVRPLVAVVRPGRGCSLRGRLRVVAAVVRLFVALRRNGARLVPTLKFLQSRHFQSQLLLADYPGLVFLTSMPYTYGQNPWVVEIEDPTTLFYPLVQNGHTCELGVADSPYYPIVKTLLEADHCKGIVTHMRSTAELVRTLFRSETINRKVFYQPLGVRLPERWQRHDDTEHINLLFINSWCQMPTNFQLRGGLEVLEAFATLRERYPQLRLTLRTGLPGLAEHYHRIIEAGWVRVIDRFLSAEEMEALLAESHVFLLPAARVHIVSLLQAMSYGLAVVASDGWGIEEYVTHGRNGLIVKGRYGKVAWADHQAGVLREDYGPMLTPDPEVVGGLVDAVSLLVEDHELRKRLGRAARRDVETTFSLERWNRGLKEAFDRGLSGGPAPGPAAPAVRELVPVPTDP
jgi:glycosyltransferase involved in cell wall biosynthesis